MLKIFFLTTLLCKKHKCFFSFLKRPSVRCWFIIWVTISPLPLPLVIRACHTSSSSSSSLARPLAALIFHIMGKERRKRKRIERFAFPLNEPFLSFPEGIFLHGNYFSPQVSILEPFTSFYMSMVFIHVPTTSL